MGEDELGPVLELHWAPYAAAPPAAQERARHMLAAALESGADEPELAQLLAWMRVHLLRQEASPEDDADAADRLLDALG